MEFGIHLPDAGRDPSREAIIEVATLAERLDYASVWSSDHIAWPDPATLASKYPYADDNSGFPPAGSPWLDCIGTLLFVAAVTERVQLGTTVVILGYRGAVQQAKGWATLDHLSQGRAIIGAGVGWMQEEFEAINMPWEERGRRADETLEIFEELFSEGSSTFEGRYQSFTDIGFSPKPERGRIPIWIGGHSGPAFRRTAAYGDAFHAAFASPTLLAEHWANIGAACQAIERDPSELQLTSLLRLNFDAGDLEAGEVGGSTEEVIDQIGRYHAIGLEHAAFFVIARGHEARTEAIERFAQDIAPHFA